MPRGKRTKQQKENTTSYVIAKSFVLLLCTGLFLNQSWREFGKYLQELRSTAVSHEREPGLPMPNILLCRAKAFRSDSTNQIK